MNSRFHIVQYSRPSQSTYFWSIFKSLLNLSFLKDKLSMNVFYCVNHTIGKRQAKIGKGTKVHATTIFRQGYNIEIGEHCLINHNNVQTFIYLR